MSDEAAGIWIQLETDPPHVLPRKPIVLARPFVHPETHTLVTTNETDLEWPRPQPVPGINVVAFTLWDAEEEGHQVCPSGTIAFGQNIGGRSGDPIGTFGIARAAMQITYDQPKGRSSSGE